MAINLIPPDFQLRIAGLDVTNLVSTIKASYAQWTPGGGLLISTGEIVLNDTPRFGEVLDDRRNARWGHGRKVELFIDGARAPICGVHYIENAAFDGEQLILNTTDRLGMANFVTPGNLGACIDIRENVRVYNVLLALLNKAGIALSNINLSLLQGIDLGILESKNVPEGSSLVGLAGQIAAGMGYVIYQRNDGVIELGDVINIIASPLALVASSYELAGYERADTGELPPNKVEVSGVVGDRFKTDRFKTYQIVKETENGPETTTKNVEIAFAARSIITETETIAPTAEILPKLELGGFVLRDNTIEIAYYEAEPSSYSGPFGAFDISPDEDCAKRDEGRLYERVATVKADRRIVIAPWLEQALAAGQITVDDATYRDGGNITDSITTEKWEYNLPTLDTLQINQSSATTSTVAGTFAGTYFAKYERIKRTALGQEIPVFGRYAGNDPGEIVLNPNTLITSEVETTHWKLDTNYNTWTKTRRVFKTRYSVKPEEIQAMLLNQQVHPLSVTYGVAKALILFLQEVEEDSPPPDFGRMPPEAMVQYTPYKASYTLLANGNRREVNFSLADYTNTAADSIGIAETYGRWELGRYKSMNVTLPLTLMNASEYPLLVPVISSAVVREANINTNMHFAIDGPSLLLSPEEAVITFTGLFLGSEGPVKDNSASKTGNPDNLGDLDFGAGGEDIDLTKLGYDENEIPAGDYTEGGAPGLPPGADEAGDFPDLNSNSALKNSGLSDRLSGAQQTGGTRPNTGLKVLNRIENDAQMTQRFGAEEVNKPLAGVQYPNVSSQNRRASSNQQQLGGNDGGGANPGGFAMGGWTWERPLLDWYKLPSEREDLNLAASQQQQQTGADGFGGGGGGGLPPGGGGLVFPQGYPSVEPLQQFGSGAGVVGAGGGGGGGGGFGGGGFPGGGGAGGGGGGGYSTAGDEPIVLYMFWGLFTAFPELSGELLDVTLEGFLDFSEQYLDEKKSPILMPII